MKKCLWLFILCAVWNSGAMAQKTDPDVTQYGPCPNTSISYTAIPANTRTISSVQVTTGGTITNNPNDVPTFRSGDITVDGQTGTSQLCSFLSSHTLRIDRVYGADNNCISWNDHGTTQSSYSNCDQINFTLRGSSSGYSYSNGAFITAYASNRCGIGTREISMYPVKCRQQWGFIYRIVISPNPVSNESVLTLLKKDEGDDKSTETIQILNEVEIMDFQGGVLKTLKVNDTQCIINASDLKDGLYTARVRTEEGFVATQFVVKH
jgi:hypothetical protein